MKLVRCHWSERATLLTFVCVLALATLANWVKYLRHDNPRYYPLYSRTDQFRDLTNYSSKMLDVHGNAAKIGTGLPIFNYEAPAAYVYHLLLIQSHPVRVFIAIIGGSFLMLLVASAGILVRKKLFRLEHALVLTALALSYPMMFLLDRANLEGVVWALSTAAICCFLGESYFLSALFLGLAISIKPFPVLLVLLFIFRRKFAPLALCLSVAAVTVAAAMEALGPGIVGTYRALEPGMQLYFHTYTQMFRGPDETSFSHGLLDCLKILWFAGKARAFHVDLAAFHNVEAPHSLLVTYTVLSAALVVLLVWRLRKLPIANQIFGLSIALTLLPPGAADYTLCSLYVPVLLMVFYLAEEVRRGQDEWDLRHVLLLVVPCALLLSPLRLFTAGMSVIRCALLVVVLTGVLTLPMRSRSLDRQLA